MTEVKEVTESLDRKKGETKSDGPWNDGYVSKYHLIYPMLIAIGFIVLLLSVIFQDSEYAGEMLSFAATLSSILLAVIAILITLIDVAGQRNNILDVKNSVEELKTIRTDITVLIKDSEERNNRSNEMIITALEVFKEANKEDLEKAIEKIKTLKINTSDLEEEEKVKDVQVGLEKALNRLDIKAFQMSDERKNEILKNALRSTKTYKIDFHQHNKEKKE